jgi:hypothetical protein
LEAVAVSVAANGNTLSLTAHIRSKDTAAAEALTKAMAESMTKAGLSVERRAVSPDRPEDWRQFAATGHSQRFADWLAGLRRR